jgi:arylsulfatase A-like enzyme
MAPDRPGDVMIRGHGWKYCRYTDGDEYLYHLADDPGETKNLAHDPDNRGILATLRRELERFRGTKSDSAR